MTDPRKVTKTRRSARSIALAFVATLALAGCASRPAGVLTPIEAPAENRRVELLAATTRAADPDPGHLFSGDRGGAVSFARIEVALPPGREPGSVQWPASLPANPKTDFAVTQARTLDKAQVRQWFREPARRGKRVFVYIHGFNTPFDRSVLRTAQFVHDADAQATPVLFSWPSRGRLFDYKRDLDNASYSRSDLAELLAAAADAPAIGEVVVLAHSMGSWVTVEALKQLALRRGGLPPKIRHVILASPDLDTGVFRRQVLDMGARRPDFTIFVSQQDRALQLSQFIARSGSRLGAVDLTDTGAQAELGDLERVTVIDLSALNSGDRINHSLYADSPDVVRLIGDRLIAGQALDTQQADGPFSLVEGLGSAVRLVVAAPSIVLEAAAGQ
jgi:esterase/lipase superfamily enzyme